MHAALQVVCRKYMRCLFVLATTWRQNKGMQHLPALDEVLPDVVLELVRVWQFLYQVLDSVLPKPKEIWPRYRIGVLPVPDTVCLAHDV